MRGLREAVTALNALLDDEDGVVRVDGTGFVEVDLAPFRVERPDEAQQRLAETLHDQFTVIEERVVPQGAEVTVFGRYRALDRTIDVGGATRDLARAVKLGSGGRVAGRTVVQALVTCAVFSLLLGLLSVAILVPVARSWVPEPYTGSPLTLESVGAARLRAEAGAKLLVDAVNAGDEKKAALLLALGVHPNGTALDTTPLESARDTESLRLVLAAGADPNGASAYGRTKLHEAALRDDTEAARLLLDAGADPNREDESGATPLDDARANGHVEMEALLLERGAVETEVTSETGTPIVMGHASLVAIDEYLSALQAQDVARIRALFPRPIDWSSTHWEPFLESRPVAVSECSGYASEERATVRVHGPTASGAPSMTLGFQLERSAGEAKGAPYDGWRIRREWLVWVRRAE